jgi:hypothetical protein
MQGVGPQAEADLRDPDRRGRNHRGDFPHGALTPARVRRVAHFFAENPNLMRLLGAAQVAFGIWLAQRQYHGR